MESGPDAMRRYRQLRGRMSQHDLAIRVGVTTGAISQIERAVNVPRRDTAERIDRALEAGGEVLAAFGYSGEPGKIPGDPEVTRLRGEVARLGRAVRELARVVGVTLDDESRPGPTDVDRPGESGS